MHEKNKLHHKYCRLPNDYNIERYWACCNSQKTQIKSAKCHNAAISLSGCDNSQQQWKVIDKHIQPGSKQHPFDDIQHVFTENVKIKNPYENANVFNEYFTSIWPKLASTINAYPVITALCNFSIYCQQITLKLPKSLISFENTVRHRQGQGTCNQMSSSYHSSSPILHSESLLQIWNCTFIP